MDGKFEAREFFRQETWGCEIFQTACLSSVKTGNNGCLFLVLSFQTEIEMCVLSAVCFFLVFRCLTFSFWILFVTLLRHLSSVVICRLLLTMNVKLCVLAIVSSFITLIWPIKIHVICDFPDNLQTRYFWPLFRHFFRWYYQSIST